MKYLIGIVALCKFTTIFGESNCLINFLLDNFSDLLILVALTSSTWAFHASVSSGVSRTTPSYCIVFDGNFSGSIEYETQDVSLLYFFLI